MPLRQKTIAVASVVPNIVAEKKPPMTSKAARKAYLKANRVPRLSKAEQRRQYAIERAQQKAEEEAEKAAAKKEREKERAAAKAKALREKKAAKEEEAKKERKKLGIPERSKWGFHASQRVITGFIQRPVLGKRKGGADVDAVEDSDGRSEGVVMEMSPKKRRPTPDSVKPVQESRTSSQRYSNTPRSMSQRTRASCAVEEIQDDSIPDAQPREQFIPRQSQFSSIQLSLSIRMPSQRKVRLEIEAAGNIEIESDSYGECIPDVEIFNPVSAARPLPTSAKVDHTIFSEGAEAKVTGNPNLNAKKPIILEVSEPVVDKRPLQSPGKGRHGIKTPVVVEPVQMKSTDRIKAPNLVSHVKPQSNALPPSFANLPAVVAGAQHLPPRQSPRQGPSITPKAPLQTLSTKNPNVPVITPASRFSTGAVNRKPTFASKNPLLAQALHLPPTNTQLFLEENMDSFFPSPSQEIRELLVDVDLPSNTQITREMLMDNVMEEPALSKPQVNNVHDELSFICTQDLIISSQDIREIESPLKSALKSDRAAEPEIFICTQDLILSSQDMREIESPAIIQVPVSPGVQPLTHRNVKSLSSKTNIQHPPCTQYSFLSTQDLEISSQDLRDIDTPSKPPPSLLPRLRSQKSVQSLRPPASQTKSRLWKPLFFKEKEEDLLHAAIEERRKMAEMDRKGAKPSQRSSGTDQRRTGTPMTNRRSDLRSSQRASWPSQKNIEVPAGKKDDLDSDDFGYGDDDEASMLAALDAVEKTVL
jgi:hypothetical protein